MEVSVQGSGRSQYDKSGAAGSRTYQDCSTDGDSSSASDFEQQINMNNYHSSSAPSNQQKPMADIRLRIHLCQRAWSLLVRSRLNTPMNLAMKFPAVVVMILGTVFLVYTYTNLPVGRHLDTHSAQIELEKFQANSFNNGGPRMNRNMISASELHPMPKRKPRDRHNGTWQPLGANIGLEGYAYSAFYDDRISLATLPEVRIIVVVQEFEGRNMWCVLKYDHGTKVEHVRLLPSDIGAGIYRKNKVFKEYLFSCQLTHEQVPETVGIVERKADTPSFDMPIEIPARQLVRENFGMCVSVTYWKHSPHQIVEWMEFLRLMGVARVTIYNNSLEAEAANVFTHYDLQGFVEFRQSHNFIHEDGELSIHMHMSPVINDCMYRNLYRYKKIIITDLDELIVPRTTDNYYDMMVEAEKAEIAKGNEHPAKHFLFRNNYFFLDTPNGEDVNQSPHLVTMRHRKKIPVSENGYAIKSIIDPLSCQNMHNHYCWKSTPIYNTGYENVEVEPDVALNQHYKKCHLDFWEKPGACKVEMAKATWDENILRFKDALVKAVKPQLELLGLAPL